MPSFPPSMGALISPITSVRELSEIKLTLMNAYPDEYPVKLVHAAGSGEQEVQELPLYAIDQSPKIGLMTTLYLPPREEGRSFEDFRKSSPACARRWLPMGPRADTSLIAVLFAARGL